MCQVCIDLVKEDFWIVSDVKMYFQQTRRIYIKNQDLRYRGRSLSDWDSIPVLVRSCTEEKVSFTLIVSQNVLDEQNLDLRYTWFAELMRPSVIPFVPTDDVSSLKKSISNVSWAVHSSCFVVYDDGFLCPDDKKLFEFTSVIEVRFEKRFLVQIVESAGKSVRKTFAVRDSFHYSMSKIKQTVEDVRHELQESGKYTSINEYLELIESDQSDDLAVVQDALLLDLDHQGIVIRFQCVKTLKMKFRSLFSRWKLESLL